MNEIEIAIKHIEMRRKYLKTVQRNLGDICLGEINGLLWSEELLRSYLLYLKEDKSQNAPF